MIDEHYNSSGSVRTLLTDRSDRPQQPTTNQRNKSMGWAYHITAKTNGDFRVFLRSKLRIEVR